MDEAWSGGVLRRANFLGLVLCGDHLAAGRLDECFVAQVIDGSAEQGEFFLRDRADPLPTLL